MLSLIYYKNGGNIVVNTWDAQNYIDNIVNTPDTVQKITLLEFVNGNYYYDLKSKKKIMQSLRHFDEIGISNELWEELDNMPSDTEYFYITTHINNNIIFKKLVKENFKVICEEL